MFFLIFLEEMVNLLIIYHNRLDIGNYLVFVSVRILLFGPRFVILADLCEYRIDRAETNCNPFEYLSEPRVKSYTHIVGFGLVSQSLLYLVVLFELRRG